jgi:hypothetical protein
MAVARTTTGARRTMVRVRRAENSIGGLMEQNAAGRAARPSIGASPAQIP